MAQNPLVGYFRRPAIYIQLPSNGNLYPPTALDMPENGELPVLPMTAADEITYKTPDALFNGQAIAEIIQSCVPNIKNAWYVPGIDLDKILIAIRIASNGHQMDIDTTCPACENSDRYGVDLRLVLEQLGSADYSKTLKIGDLTIGFRPLTLHELNQNNLAQFEEQKIYAYVASSEDSDEEKIKHLSEAFKKLSQLTISALSQTIHYIQTAETTVQEPEHITEFLYNCDKSVFDAIKDFAINVKMSTEIEPVHIKCSECGHEYDQPFTVNMSTFFG